MPNPIVGLVGASAVGTVAQVGAARSAARAQENAARAQLDVQERMFLQSRDDLAPYRDSGLPAQNALSYYLGLTDERPEGMVGFQETPGFQFARDQGLAAVESGAAARGGLYSGSAMQALQQRGNDLANLEFGNYLSRLEGQATRGSNAAAQTATINTNNAQMQSNSLANLGNAQSSGAIGVGNAINSGINSGINIWGYNNALNSFGGGLGGGA